jgi:Immunoglobulin I-set domain
MQTDLILFFDFSLAALPAFEDEPQDQRRIEGQTARMACFLAAALPAPKVTWFKEDRPLIRDARMFVLPSGALEIASVRPADAGSYKCKVENVEGEKFSAVGRLMVDEDPGQCREETALSGSFGLHQHTEIRNQQPKS